MPRTLGPGQVKVFVMNSRYACCTADGRDLMTDCLPWVGHPLGRRFSHSSPGLVKCLKMALLSLEDSALTLFPLFL